MGEWDSIYTTISENFGENVKINCFGLLECKVSLINVFGAVVSTKISAQKLK